jgi:plasmid stabilization system protein ParE
MIAIGQFTEVRWGRDQRRAIQTKLRRLFQRLADSPGLGTLSGIVHPESRSFPMHPFSVIYLPGNEGVTILRVYHQRQRQTDNSPDTFIDESE